MSFDKMYGKPSSVVTEEIYRNRELLTGRKITLDGEPARLLGLRLNIAVIRETRNPQNEATFAWPIAARIIIEENGEFCS